MKAACPRECVTTRAAAAAMERGWSVFPVQGKRPATTHGLLDASRDFDLIEERWPNGTTRGLALATGEVSGVWVLDLDGPDATDRFLDLQHEHGTVPTTITSCTSRGFHLFFRIPAGGDVRNSAGKVGEGIDVRGSGGYVVLPPSPHPSGAVYAWAKGRGPEEVAAAVAPAWLLQLVQRPLHIERNHGAELPPVDEPRGSRYVAAAIEAECIELASAPEGTRNEALNRAAFSLARFVTTGEASPRDVARHLAHAAARAGLRAGEIERTLQSAFRARGAA